MTKHSENVEVKIMGIDLAKNSFHVYGVNVHGRKIIKSPEAQGVSNQSTTLHGGNGGLSWRSLLGTPVTRLRA